MFKLLFFKSLIIFFLFFFLGKFQFYLTNLRTFAELWYVLFEFMTSGNRTFGGKLRLKGHKLERTSEVCLFVEY